MQHFMQGGLLRVEHLAVQFPSPGPIATPPVFKDLAFSVPDRRFVAIVGRSGCGKTTLLRALMGLQGVTQGDVRWKGARVRDLSAHAGMVFQSPHLLPWRSAAGNIAFGLEARGVSRRQIDAKLPGLLALTGLEAVAHKRPFELSGGMQQRVNLARALAIEPEVLLMDEPFSALDSLLREQLQQELQRLWQHNPCLVMFVTHQLDEAAWLADEVWVMSGAPAAITHRLSIDLPRPRERDAGTMARVAAYQHQLRVWLGGAG